MPRITWISFWEFGGAWPGFGVSGEAPRGLACLGLRGTAKSNNSDYRGNFTGSYCISGWHAFPVGEKNSIDEAT
jgi:hypothetical protein